jgi:two-component system LytT family response regulator
MRAIIVDDEVTSSEVLEKLITHYLPQLEIVAICSKPTEALKQIQALQPDLLFLDIEMPEMNGFELLEKVPHISFDIIFTTAHSQYGIKAIQFSAIDYLLKPIDTDELTAAYERVVEHRKFSSPFEKIKLLLENIQLFNNNNPFARIALPTMEGLKFIFATDIVRCMSTNNYTYIFLNNGEKILVSKTLKEMEHMLSTPAFCRVHNSHLINLKYVSKLLKGDSNVIIMSDNAEVEVSRRKKDELIKTLNL